MRGVTKSFSTATLGIGGRYVSAEILIIWVCVGSLGLTDHLAESVGAARSTVGPSKSGLADVRHPATVPEDGVLRAVRGGLQTSYQAMVTHEGGLAKRTSRRTEVDDGIARPRRPLLCIDCSCAPRLAGIASASVG